MFLHAGLFTGKELKIPGRKKENIFLRSSH
jgi:hypothetical protein